MGASLRLGWFLSDPAHVDSRPLHAERDGGDGAADYYLVTVLVSVQVSDERVKVTIDTSECLAFNSFVGKNALHANRSLGFGFVSIGLQILPELSSEHPFCQWRATRYFAYWGIGRGQNDEEVS